MEKELRLCKTCKCEFFSNNQRNCLKCKNKKNLEKLKAKDYYKKYYEEYKDEYKKYYQDNKDEIKLKYETKKTSNRPVGRPKKIREQILEK